MLCLVLCGLPIVIDKLVVHSQIGLHVRCKLNHLIKRQNAVSLYAMKPESVHCLFANVQLITHLIVVYSVPIELLLS